MLISKVATLQDNSAHGDDSFLSRDLGDNAFLDVVMDGVTGHGGYCTYHFGPDAAPEMIEAMLQMEQNLELPLETNPGTKTIYELVKSAGSRIPPHYLEKDYRWRLFMQKAALDLTAMYLRPKPNASLLDVGCGSGKRMQLLRDLGWSVEGVDNDLQAIGQAQNKGLNVRLGNLEEQEYSDNRFDAITMSHVIEHVHQPLSLLQECHRILKPGGKLVVVTPNAESWGHRLFKDAWVHLDPPRHLHLYSSKTLRKLVGKVYFGNIKTFTTLHWHDITFQGSKSVGQTGRYIIDGSQTWNTNIWARSMEFLSTTPGRI